MNLLHGACNCGSFALLSLATRKMQFVTKTQMIKVVRCFQCITVFLLHITFQPLLTQLASVVQLVMTDQPTRNGNSNSLRCKTAAGITSWNMHVHVALECGFVLFGQMHLENNCVQRDNKSTILSIKTVPNQPTTDCCSRPQQRKR